MIIVSTDGSCLRNPGGAIGWAWVNHAGGSASGGAPSGTNQIAELRALLEAIRAHPGAEPLFIESDSLYAIKCASEWINGWRRNGWKTSTGGPVKNLELIRQIDQAISTRSGPVRFRWVRGHVGNYFNEQADTLCGQAARAIASGTLDPSPEPAPSEPVTEPIPLEPATEEIPVISPVESVAVTEKVVAQAHTAPATPRRRTAAKAPAADALTLF
ncbi:ribonuclease H family protein [Nocardia acidivorans]|uniref:ribonuclease H family protein n=1 Tax=Nocardia acidivorans TaxID=404580 RepID=UPI00082A8A25|nr:ribonuclease H [Nocardia acidivorans]